MRTFFVCTILVFFVLTDAFGQKHQTVFFDEDSFRSQAQIPNSVLKTLKQDAEVQRCIKAANTSKYSASWFEATKVKLNDDKFLDLLVKAKEGCLRGNATNFWFFRNKQNKYELVLSDYTIVIDILKRRTKGFYNIETSRSTANTTFSTIYTFNGKKYTERRKYETPIKY